MKGELERLVAVVASWLSGYGSYSQIPWVRVLQLPFFSLFSFLPEQVEFQQNFYSDDKRCCSITYVCMCIHYIIIMCSCITLATLVAVCILSSLLQMCTDVRMSDSFLSDECT